MRQSWTVYYLWMPTCPQYHCFVEKMALVSLWVAFVSKMAFLFYWGSQRLVTWFPHNSTLETLVNAEVGWNVSIIPCNLKGCQGITYLVQVASLD